MTAWVSARDRSASGLKRLDSPEMPRTSPVPPVMVMGRGTPSTAWSVTAKPNAVVMVPRPSMEECASHRAPAVPTVQFPSLVPMRSPFSVPVPAAA